MGLPLLTSLLLHPGVARAETARLLPDGSTVVYAGLGLSTSRKLRYGDGTTTDADGDPIGDATLDRLVKPRIDLYAGHGVTPWLQVSARLPLVSAFALADGDTGPCPDQGPAGFCDPVVSVGEAGVEARFGAVTGDLSVTPALAVTSDIWNAGSRGRYTSTGDASVAVVPGLLLSYERDLGAWSIAVTGSGRFAWNVGRRTLDYGPAAPLAAPGDEFFEVGEVTVGLPAPVALAVGIEGVQRPSGVDWEGSYYSEYWVDNEDRWAVLRYQHVAVRGRLSVSAGDAMGLHLQGGRVVDVRNGPPDTWDFGIGWHRYFAPRSR
ncbi:MAG: hypothetical protein D6798_14810 [Deltaproteobacteria bacterium]|nr:MAG: hypothetical protein D6798_14810 [Deltaproteobacteria bacterium]